MIEGFEVIKKTTFYIVNPKMKLVDGKPDYQGSTMKRHLIWTGNTGERMLEVVKAFVDSENGGSLLLVKSFTKRPQTSADVDQE